MHADRQKIRNPGLFRVFGVVLLVLGGIVGAVVGTFFVMLRMVRGNQDRVKQLMRLRLWRWCNDLACKSAGGRHSPLALLTHVGRRSGRTYQTPLGAVPQGDGFVLALAFGRQVDWCQNVLTAETCRLAYKGKTYELERPEIVSAAEVERVWPAWRRMAIRGHGHQDFLWLHEKKQNAPTSQQAEPLVKHGAQ